MFIVRFQGGLGNQMFQYAFLKALEHVYLDVEVKADITTYRLEKYHEGYELKNIFGIELKAASRKDIMRLSHYIPSWQFNPYLFRVKRKLLRDYEGNGRKKTEIVQKKSLMFYKQIFEMDKKQDLFLDGFWCNEKYFSMVEDNIRQTFVFPRKLYEEKREILNHMGITNSISVHIRRGDYVGTGFDVLPMTYYIDAIEYIRKEVKNPVFYFFSDDIEYVKNKFSFLKNKIFINDNQGINNYKDMFLMSQCKHNIIANSTFSYWGAYLNKNSCKIIIAPSVFTEEQKMSLANKDWIVLP